MQRKEVTNSCDNFKLKKNPFGLHSLYKHISAVRAKKSQINSGVPINGIDAKYSKETFKDRLPIIAYVYMLSPLMQPEII